MKTLSTTEQLYEAVLASLPASITSAASDKAIKKTLESLRRYFIRLKTRLPLGRIKAFIEKWQRRKPYLIESVDSEAALLFRRMLEEGSPELYEILVDSLGENFSRGANESLDDWVTRIGAVGDYISPTSAETLAYIKEFSAELVTNIDAETRDILVNVVIDGLEQQKGVPGISKMIRDQIDDMSKTRSDLIARTETNKALSSGEFTRSKSLGSTHKEWLTVGDDRVREAHLANEAQGRIPIDSQFGSGEMFPGEPNCRCVVSYFGAKAAK